MRAVAVIALLAIAAVAGANAASRLDKLKAKTLIADDFTTPAGCVAKSGKCMKVTDCKSGSVVRGLCPGDSSVACCVTAGTVPPPPPTPTTGLPALLSIVDTNTCTKRSWNDRGQAPRQYLRGLAASFAKAVCNPTRADVAFVGKAELGTNDALAWYGDILKSKLGATSAGIVTVRQLYTLLAGLGMRESSGVYCTGRDMSASFSSADTAEAGLFQTSWGAHTRSPLLDQLFAQYSASKAGCASTFYSAGLTCSASNNKNWGSADQKGYQWQALTKACPSFATEYAAVLLRLNGGAKGEWGPLRKRVAEVVPDCHNMFLAVQNLVNADRSICAALQNLA